MLRQVSTNSSTVSKGASLRALATSSPAKAARFTDFAPDLQVRSDYQSLVDDPQIDAVYIPLPNHLHVEWSLKALAAVDNPQHRLKVGMFGSVRILAGEISDQLAVPADAVQSIDGQPYLFIQEEADLFELRRVDTGADRNGLVVISTGLNQHEQVVAGQGFALKSEVLKARLGASCADH